MNLSFLKEIVKHSLAVFLPYNLVKRIVLQHDSLLMSRVLEIKEQKRLVKDPCILQSVDNGKFYIEFSEDSNKYEVFNMCYMSALLGKALLAVSLGAAPKFSVCDLYGENYFDTYFEPISIDGKKKLNANIKRICYNSGGIHWFAKNTEQRAYAIIYRHYFRIKKPILNKYTDELKRVLSVSGGGRLYGCVIRGTDYAILKPKSHPVQPDVMDVIDWFHRNIDSKDYIYLATDEKKVVDLFSNEFTNRIITSESMYYDGVYSSPSPYIGQYKFNRKNDKFLRGYQYFERVYILSKCDAYVGGMSGAAKMALMMNDGKYKLINVFNKGLY